MIYEIISIARTARLSKPALIPWDADALTYTEPNLLAQALADGARAIFRLGDQLIPDQDDTLIPPAYAVDATLNGYDGVATNVHFGSPGAIAGDPDTAARFDGGSAVITIPAAALQPDRGGFTLLAFAKGIHSGLGNQTLVHTAWGSGAHITLRWTNAGFAEVSCSPDGSTTYTATGSDALTDGAWRGVALVVPNDGTAVRLVVDAATVATTAGPTAASFFPTGSWLLGSAGTTAWFRGWLDDVLFFPSALTDAQLQGYADFMTGDRVSRIFPVEPTADASRVPTIPAGATVLAGGAPSGVVVPGRGVDITVALGETITLHPTGDAAVPNGGKKMAVTGGAGWLALVAPDTITFVEVPAGNVASTVVQLAPIATALPIIGVTFSVWAELLSTPIGYLQAFVVDATGAVRNVGPFTTVLTAGFSPYLLAAPQNPFTVSTWRAADFAGLTWGLRMVCPGGPGSFVAYAVQLDVDVQAVPAPAWLDKVITWRVPTGTLPTNDSPSFEGLTFNDTPPLSGVYDYVARCYDKFGRASRLLGPATVTA